MYVSNSHNIIFVIINYAVNVSCNLAWFIQILNAVIIYVYRYIYKIKTNGKL